MDTDAAPPRRGRPTASSRDHIEAVAMRLFAVHGFARTTVPMIAEESGVGRATVFRYWGTKSEIVWAEFDRHIARLAELLDAESGTEGRTLDILRRVVVANLGVSIDASAAWFARFALVDESEELRSEEARHWADWASTIAVFIADREGYAADELAPQSIAGAVQGAFLSVLRSRHGSPDVTASEILPVLDRALASLLEPLHSWLEANQLIDADS